MITAIDTNILLDLLLADPKFLSASERTFRRCVGEGKVVASEVVWAETATGFGDELEFRNSMNGLLVSFSPMSAEAALLAGQAWRHYRAMGGTRLRIASDFLIGAHALICADRLLTRDRGFYRRYFSGLRILDPTAANAS